MSRIAASIGIVYQVCIPLRSTCTCSSSAAGYRYFNLSGSLDRVLSNACGASHDASVPDTAATGLLQVIDVVRMHAL